MKQIFFISMMIFFSNPVFAAEKPSPESVSEAQVHWRNAVACMTRAANFSTPSGSDGVFLNGVASP